MDYFYYIFETIEGEVLTVSARTEEEAREIMDDLVGDFDYTLTDSFIADAYGDDIIDSMGLDVY